MAFADFYQGFAGLGKAYYDGLDEYTKKQTLSSLGDLASSGDYAAAAKLGFASGRPELGLGLLQLGRETQAAAEFGRLMGGGSPSASVAAPAAPSGALPTLAGGGGQSMRQPADPAIRGRFIDTVKAGGLTNPHALAVVDAYGQAESGWNPGNVARTWSDPSQSGQPGTSGGLFSWRGPRLAAMQAATRGAEDPIVAQAKFFLTENPEVTVALQNAKSVEEAHQILANAWRFSGYDQPGQGEYQKRYNMARFLSRRYAGDPPAPQPAAGGEQVAQADLPAQGGREVQQFTIPGDPSQIPIPANITQRMTQLRQALAIPGLPAAQRQVAQAEMSQLQQEAQQYRTNEFARLREDRREAQRTERERVRTVTDPAERTSLGVDPNYKGVVQVDGNGRVTLPGKATNEVNVDLKGETEFTKKTAGAMAERFDAISKEGDAGRLDKAMLGQLQAYGEVINNDTLPAARAKLAEFGIKIGADIGAVEAYGSLIDKLVPAQRIPGSGTTSDFDARGFKASLPSLMATPEGRGLINRTLQALADDKVARAEIADRAITGELKPADAIRELRALPAPNLAFKSGLSELAKSGKLGAKAQDSAPARQAVPAGTQKLLQPGQELVRNGVTIRRID
ncbi:hypothetical protein [Enterovirga sp. CN4-39]|uniref:hypothetical protein n=1 Tax=Enterovirga sp. CN4-39 TaxID=3400910 RepID=UPI003BFB3CF9